MHHINQLRAVVALAEIRNFGRAAQSINVTQSALSQNIKKLEEYYGVTLFERKRGQVTLTAYGEVVESTARQLISSIDNLKTEISLIQNFNIGRINIGVDPYLTSALVGPVLAKLLADHPHLKFTVQSGNYQSIETELRDGRCDVFIGYKPTHLPPDLDVRDIDLPTPLVVGSRHHPLHEKAFVTLEDALAYPIVTPTPPAWYVQWANEQLADKQDDTPIDQLMVLEADSIAMVKTVATDSLALTAALPSDLTKELQASELKVIKLNNWPVTMPGCAVTKPGKPLHPAMQLFDSELNKHLKLELSKRTEYY